MRQKSDTEETICENSSASLGLKPRIAVVTMDVKFGIQIGPDWPQMGQIWDIMVRLTAIRRCIYFLVFREITMEVFDPT